MYVISRSSALTVPIRAQSTEYTSTGVVKEVHRALSVQFHRNAGAPDWAKAAVSKLPGFGKGMGHNEDPFSRVGVVDTDEEAKRQQWTSEEKKVVETALIGAKSNGIEYVICSAPKTARPWDKYDEFVGTDAVEKILYTVELIGADPAMVLRYERENDNRPEVVDALESLIEEEEEGIVGVISA